MIDGVAATPDNTGNYTLPAGNKQYTITVTDKAGNNTLCTVTVNDGHDWNEAIYTWKMTEVAAPLPALAKMTLTL